MNDIGKMFFVYLMIAMVLLGLVCWLSFFILPFFILPWGIVMLIRKIKGLPQNKEINRLFLIAVIIYVISLLAVYLKLINIF